MARPSSPGGLSGVRHLQIWWRPGSRRRRRGGTGGRSARGCGRRSSSGRTRSRPTRRSGSRSRPTTSRSGPCPAYWIENKGVNSLWHVPIPPQAVGARLHYRSAARARGSETVYSPFQDTIVRPNLPDRTESAEIVPVGPEGLVGNRMMTVRVDARGSTYDVYFPTVGLHSDVRPAEGDLPQSRSHFRAIVGGLAVGRRLDWFTERLSLGGVPALPGGDQPPDDRADLAERADPRADHRLRRHGRRACPGRPAGPSSPGQYIKRFRIKNEGTEPRRALFGVYIQAEVNGGIGEPGLSWHDGDRTLLATNRGHGHANRKLARDATVEFAIALDGRGDVHCEPTGPNEAILLRWLDLPAGESVTVDLLVSGAFTGWRGDPGTFEHWLRPALAWFRAADLDQVEQTTGAGVGRLRRAPAQPPLPQADLRRQPAPLGAGRRAARRRAVGCDRLGVRSRPERLLLAPRGDLGRRRRSTGSATPRSAGASSTGWPKVRGQNRPLRLLVPEVHDRRRPGVGDPRRRPDGDDPLGPGAALPPDRRPRLRRRVLADDRAGRRRSAAGRRGTPACAGSRTCSLISSAGIWDHRFGAFLYSNACVVAGLRAAARLAELLDRPEPAARWRALADRIWETGILGRSASTGDGPGLVDPESGRFLDARRLSTLRGLWTDRPELLDRRGRRALDISMLGLVVPFGLLPASDPRMVRTAEAILRHNAVTGDPNVLARWSLEPGLARPVLRAERVAQPGRLEPGHALDGAVPDPARPRDRPGPALEPRAGDARRHPRPPLPARPEHAPARRDSTISPRFDLGAAAGVWGLHAMLIETMLDLAGLDYDAARPPLDPRHRPCPAPGRTSG